MRILLVKLATPRCLITIVFGGFGCSRQLKEMCTSSKDSFWPKLECKLKEGLTNLISTPDNYQLLLDELHVLTQLTVEDDFRSSIPDEILQLLLKIFQRPLCIPLSLESARILRNCCGKNWESFPDTWSQLLIECNQLLRSFISKDFPLEEVILARVILQCVGNVLNTQANLSHIIWESLQSEIGKLISHEDEKISLYSSSVMFGILRNSLTIRKELTTHRWRDLITELIFSSHKGVLYSQFSVKLFLCDRNLLENIYNFQELHSRTLLLHQISEFTPECKDFDVQNWRFLSRLFQERASLILRTCENPSMDLEAMEATSLIEILAKTSSDDACRRELFFDDALLVTTIDLLLSIHSLGQSGSNYFTTISDHFGSVESHPALNFKCNLVRLLGNLSYKNSSAQDRIRELDAIAPLLECCNLDARNPFIQQWSILAIRNLCEKNKANQEVIGSMTRQGVVQPSLLEDLGMVVEETDSGLCVRPSESTGNP